MPFSRAWTEEERTSYVDVGEYGRKAETLRNWQKDTTRSGACSLIWLNMRKLRVRVRTCSFLLYLILFCCFPLFLFYFLFFCFISFYFIFIIFIFCIIGFICTGIYKICPFCLKSVFCLLIIYFIKVMYEYIGY